MLVQRLRRWPNIKTPSALYTMLIDMLFGLLGKRGIIAAWNNNSRHHCAVTAVKYITPEGKPQDLYYDRRACYWSAGDNETNHCWI